MLRRFGRVLEEPQVAAPATSPTLCCSSPRTSAAPSRAQHARSIWARPRSDCGGEPGKDRGERDDDVAVRGSPTSSLLPPSLKGATSRRQTVDLMSCGLDTLYQRLRNGRRRNFNLRLPNPEN